MKILVVEDDQTVAQTLQILFSSYTYAVDIAADGAAGLQMAQAFDYDLVILDVILPKLDGISLCQQLRAEGYRMPILLLTGRDGGHQKAIALNIGADDYVVKPFDAEELIARVQALLRRGSSTAQPILEWGPLRIDPSSQTATYGDHLLTLTPKEYAILELFLRNGQKVFNAKAILDHAWSSVESPGEEAVRVHIKELRQKLKAAGAPPNFIKTVYRVGYQLNPVYSSFVASQLEEQPTVPQVAVLKSVNAELRTALEDLQHTNEALRQQNEALAIAHPLAEVGQFPYQAWFERVPTAYVITDAQGCIQAANQAAIHLLRANPDGLQGQRLTNLVVPPESPTFDTWLNTLTSDPVRQAAQNPAPTCTVTLQPGQGERIAVQLTATPLDDEQPQADVLWGLQAVQPAPSTEQLDPIPSVEQRQPQAMSALERTAEALFNATEEKLSGILDNAIAAISSFRVFANRDWDYEYWSKGCATLFTYSLQDLTADKHFWLSQVHPDDLEQVLMPLFDDFFAERDVTAEYRFRCNDGSIRWFLSTYSSRRIADDCWLVTTVNADITDRKQAEQNLQEMSTALSNAVEGISRLDAQGRYLFANEAYARAVGYAPDEMIGLNWQTTVHPDDLAALIDAYHYMVRTGKVEIEARGLRKDGSIFDKQLVMVAVYDDQQSCTGHYCFMKDISEKKQLEADRQRAEAELKQSEQKFRAIFNSTFEFMGLLTPDGKVVEANRAALDIMAIELSDVVGQPFWETAWWVHFPEQHEQLKQAIASAAQGEFVRFETKHQWADGTLACVDFSLKPVFDEAGTVVMLVPEGRDITERKQAEKKLRDSEARYRLLFENNPNPIWVFDVETLAFLAVNQAAIAHYGYSVDEFLNMTIADIRPHEDIPALRLGLAKLAPGTNYTGVWRHLRKDGALIDVEILAHTFTFEGKRVCLVIINDITERLKAEQQIREQAALLDIASDAIFVCDRLCCMIRKRVRFTLWSSWY